MVSMSNRPLASDRRGTDIPSGTWNRAVLLVGPNRAGQFIHLIPVFGTLLSVLLLGERLFAYHLVGIVTVASGILMATRYGRRSES